MPKKEPLRQCVGCNERKTKKELIRVIKTPEDEILIDRTGKLNGRGAYLCDSEECFNKARKTGRLSNSLKTKIPDEIYEQLERQWKLEDTK